MYKEMRERINNTNSASSPTTWGVLFSQSKGITIIDRLRITTSQRMRLLKKYLKKGEKILDAGCGGGDWVACLNESEFIADGLDYSQEIVNNLVVIYPQYKWIVGDIQNLPIQSNHYDAIISWGAIEHTEDGPIKALKEFFRVLKKEGIIFVTVPRHSELTENAYSIQFKDVKDPVFWQYDMTPDELAIYCKNAGFEIIEKGVHGPASFGTVFPQLYKKLCTHPFLIKLMIYFFAAMFFWKKDWYFMAYCIARK